ncbi:hypothetical protein MHU86_19857 [Fragilaria crotonensis]|nr:hypothetical protein MHU86_19857 [Fragilaria crotonensis]
MTGSPRTRSTGQVRKSPRRNNVGQKTGKGRSREKEEDDRKSQKTSESACYKSSSSSSSYENESDPSDDDDGNLFAGRVVPNPTIAAVVEVLEDDDDDDDCADKKEAGDADEEDDYASATSHEETPPQRSKIQRRLDDEDVEDEDREDDYASATSHEETPPRRSKIQRRLYDEDVEDEDRNNRASSTSTLSMQRKSSGRKENGESAVVNLDVPIRGMSKSESRRNQQEYATQRVKAFVTSKVFRKIKFISNDDMLREAMDWVMRHEKVPQDKRLMYRVVYESVFNESLNAKRSTCETAGKKIVVEETMPKFQEKGKELFTIEELCTLRRAKTEREKEAAFWFFGEFLSCVVGKRVWNVQKQYQLISQATMTGSSDKLVTVSDEAFALLMYENYQDKWTKQGSAQAGQSEQSGKKVIRGKYTVQNSGTCKYGGWSHAGMRRFNELYDLVVEDRACPQAAAVEKEFLNYCIKEGNRKKVGGRISDEPTAVEGSASMLQPRYIRAAWDLNDE